jgi:hypothetical protein
VVTISVVNATWGKRYHQFIPQWWAGVESLEREPDDILIVVASDTEKAIRKSTPKRFASRTKIIVSDRDGFNDYWDEAFASASGDWLAGCSIDDYFLPEALNAIDQADAEECELVCDSVVLHPSGKVFAGVWDANRIFTDLTMPGVAPMKKSLYERVGGFDRDIYFSDWGFYIKCAAAGVKVYPTNIMRIVYDEGLTHQTMSGPLQPKDVEAMAHTQIQDLARRLR